MRFVVKVLLLPLVLVSAFLALMLRWTLNLSAFILALPMMYIFGCGLYTLYCREWTQFLILLAAEFGCFLLITAGTLIGGLIVIVYVTKNFGFRRGEIYFADLDPHYGSEQGGKRPVIVIQNNTGNKFSPTVIVAAVTSKISKKPNQPTHVLIDKNPAFNRPSVVLLEQLFTIDKERINNFMGLTSDWEMAQIEKALKCSLALDQENLVKNDSKTA